jgi:hypothetical protein
MFSSAQWMPTKVLELNLLACGQWQGVYGWAVGWPDNWTQPPPAIILSFFISFFLSFLFFLVGHPMDITSMPCL